MTWAARLYLFTIDAMGLAILLWALYRGFGPLTAQLAAYLLLAALSATRKIRLPGITGTISVSYLMVVLAAIELTLGQAIAVAVVATLTQSYWRAAKRPTLTQVLFSLASSVLATAAAWFSYPDRSSTTFGHEVWMTLMAVVAYYTVSASAFVVVVLLTERPPVFALLRSVVWPFVHYLFGGLVVAAQVRFNRLLGWEFLGIVIPAMMYIAMFWRSYLRQIDQEQELGLQKRLREQEAVLHQRTLEALALVVTAKSHDTDVRIQRAQRYARDVGQRLGLSGPELEGLPTAAMLQDIGYAAVPDYILARQDARTGAEEDKYRLHVKVSVEILTKLGFNESILAAVYGHHENWDGSGFPQAARGASIPMGARILRAINIFEDACGGLPHHVPLLNRYAGRELDPAVVKAFIAACGALEVSAVSSEESANPQRSAYIAPIAAAKTEDLSLFMLNQALGSSLWLDETASAVAARLPQLVRHDAIALYVLRGHRLTAEFSRGGTFIDCAVGEGVAGRVALDGVPILNASVNHFGPGGQLRSVIAIPLRSGDHLCGVLALYSSRANAFTREDLRILHTISGKLAASVDNALKYQHAEHEVKTDKLTGLLNASGFNEAVASLLHGPGPKMAAGVLIVCDLDHFKQLNDEFGHLAGNKALVAFATALRFASQASSSGESVCGVAARFGGDEFVAFWPDTADCEDRIQSLHESAIRIGREISGKESLRVSIGRAVYPQDGTNLEELLSKADRQMYDEKDDHHRRPPR